MNALFLNFNWKWFSNYITPIRLALKMFTYLFSISVFKHHFALSLYMLLISGSLLQRVFCSVLLLSSP